MKFTRNAALAAAMIAGLATTGCATKNYPIAVPLSAVEADASTCADLNLELIRAQETQRKIAATAETDWRSAAGFLGDFGIGNAMAKSEAERAISDRVDGIRRAQIAKHCTV